MKYEEIEEALSKKPPTDRLRQAILIVYKRRIENLMPGGLFAPDDLKGCRLDIGGDLNDEEFRESFHARVVEHLASIGVLSKRGIKVIENDKRMG